MSEQPVEGLELQANAYDDPDGDRDPESDVLGAYQEPDLTDGGPQ